jgi:hypothetical protein
MTKLIKEAIADANAVQTVAEERAKEMLIKEFSPKIKSMLASVINEEGVSVGSDQPGGYNPETDQDAIGADTSTSAEDINKKGAGPDNLAEEDELDVPAEEEPVVEGEEEEEGEEKLDEFGEGEDEVPPAPPAAPGMGDDDEVLEIVDDEIPGEGDEEMPAAPPAMEEVPPVEDDEMTPDQVMEVLRKRNIRLNKENKVLREAVDTLSRKFKKIDLFNAKLAYAFKLMTQPGLTRDTKKQIAETFDAARSVREAKLIYNTLKNALSSKINAPKKPLVNKNVKSVISESTKPASGISRMSELAGL